MTGIELIFILVALPLCVGLIMSHDQHEPPTPPNPRPYNWEEDR